MFKILHHLARATFATGITIYGRLAEQCLGKGKCHGQLSATFWPAEELSMRNASRNDLSTETFLNALLGYDGGVEHGMENEKSEPTPNRVQSTDAGVSAKISLLNLCRATRKKTCLSSLELPRCEGGKDHEVGLNEK
jgi:hypothetical protein